MPSITRSYAQLIQAIVEYSDDAIASMTTDGIMTSGNAAADGVIVGASTIARDRAEQVRAERALADASWRYRSLAENASDFVANMSPDGVITWVSPSVTRALGWVGGEI